MSERFVVSDDLRRALADGRPAVALETSVLSHGLPRPENEEAARAMEQAVRDGGAEPAWVWVGSGAVRVGASAEELGMLAGGRDVMKVARRDLPMAVADGRLGGSTVSATLWAAHRAGIEIASTGGIGGVHRRTGDVSADVPELSVTPTTLVCSGPKSILDPEATLERLEELGVGVVGYRCDRLPFFLVREASLRLEHRVDDPEAVARIARARRDLGLRGALVICNPVPEAEALPADRVEEAVARCLARSRDDGITGKSVTPFLLSCLARETGGSSVRANLALLRANAALAARVAAALG